jgi:ring-1,2-phenylacetyl-CoA epoxidase subunit PaaE
MAAPKFHDLEIAGVRAETADAVAIRFVIPDALKGDFNFTPGQYLTLRADIEGEDVRRSYSICSPLNGDALEVGVKQIEGGAFSSFAQSLKPGDRIKVMTPQGRFMAPVGGRHDYLLLAAGSGVTPMVSIARSVLEGEPDSTVTMLYANRTTESVMFKQALEDLKDQHLTRFLLTHVMDEEAQEFELFNGRLDAEKLETLTTRGLIVPAIYDAVFICGPKPMTDAATGALKAMGVSEDKIRQELFTPTGAPPVASARKATAPEGGAKVNVVLDGASRSFRMNEDESLLDAASKAGLDLPYSCANGMCATCRCKLSSGEAEMIQNFSLEKWEMEAGFVLACQTRPISEAITLDFDAV